jgi:hypothetical protein
VGEPLFIAGHELRLSASAGIARKDVSATGDSLLRDAGLALRRANAYGGGRVELFETEMRNSAIARLELEANLRRALARSDFALALQPVVRLSDTTPVHAEALVRWHAEDRVILPNEFIPVAEETGLIVPLGDWIIDRAAQLASRAPGSHVMVNLSARQLASPGLPERIARVLAVRRLPASSLGFEITETLLIEHFDYTVDVLRAIRQLGCRIGLDDFGTGYSSLSYLRRLPLPVWGTCRDVIWLAAPLSPRQPKVLVSRLEMGSGRLPPLRILGRREQRHGDRGRQHRHAEGFRSSPHLRSPDLDPAQQASAQGRFDGDRVPWSVNSCSTSPIARCCSGSSGSGKCSWTW